MADEARVADFICAILEQIYVQERRAFAKEARQRGIHLSQLAAAAITGGLYEKFFRATQNQRRLLSPRRTARTRSP